MESHWHPRTWGESLAALSGSSQNPPTPLCARVCSHHGVLRGEGPAEAHRRTDPTASDP